MYLPSAFEVSDPATLANFMEQHSFGMLFSQSRGEPFVSHLPFLVESQGNGVFNLVGHVARANPQWRDLEGQTVLVVFAGPHAYISPSWYEADNVVPTWNYVAVHAYGTAKLLDNLTDLKPIVQDLVKRHEERRERPWVFDDSTEYAQTLLQAIVGIRIEITRLEGKWKLNQNHPPERREKVASALESLDSADARAVAQLIRATLPPQ